MYYTPSGNDDFKTCGGPANQKIIRMLPENSDRLLPPPSMKEQSISYDNGHPLDEASQKQKKQFSFGGKTWILQRIESNVILSDFQSKEPKFYVLMFKY